MFPIPPSPPSASARARLMASYGEMAPGEGAGASGASVGFRRTGLDREADRVSVGTGLTGSGVAGQCRASFRGRTPELRAEILRQPAALDGFHQVGDGGKMRLLQGSQVSQELRRRSSQP